MPPPPDAKDLPSLAHHLLTNGPLKTDPSPRRVRIEHAGLTVADTSADPAAPSPATCVWEHLGYPYYYLPWAAFASVPRCSAHADDLIYKRAAAYASGTGDVSTQGGAGAARKGSVSVGTGMMENGEKERWLEWQEVGVVKAGDRGVGARVWAMKVMTVKKEGDVGREKGEGGAVVVGKCDRVLGFEGGVLNGLVRVEFASVDQWLEEDLPIQVHPKDPFKRVDTLPSTRPLRITTPSPSGTSPSPEDITLAETPFSMHLYETLLPTRYYIPLTSVRPGILRKSATRTQCPYKGEAEYYDVVLGGGEVLKDVVWYYNVTKPESVGVLGLCCFYNEKVDVWIDGVKMARPKPFRS